MSTEKKRTSPYGSVAFFLLPMGFIAFLPAVTIYIYIRIFPSLPGPRLTTFYRDASLALLQFVNQWLNFTCSRSHTFRYGRKNTNYVDKNRTHDFRTSRCAGYLQDHSGDELLHRVTISNSLVYAPRGVSCRLRHPKA